MAASRACPFIIMSTRTYALCSVAENMSEICTYCHGKGQVPGTDKEGRLVYENCTQCWLSTGKRYPPDFPRIRLNTTTVMIALLPIVLFAGSALVWAYYETVLKRQGWWPAAWKTAAVAIGIWFAWISSKFLGWALDQILRSPAWLVSLGLGLTLYLYGAYGTNLFSGALKSAIGLGLLSVGWRLLSSFVAPRFIALPAIVVGMMWSQVYSSYSIFF